MGKIIHQFSTQDDVGSWAIRAYDEGPWSHVDIVLPNNEGLIGARSDTLLGIPSGVQIRPVGYATFSRLQRVMLETSDQIENDFYAYALSQKGKPYDSFGLFSEFILHRNWRNPDAWWCSELAGFSCEKSKALQYQIATPTNVLTPNGLFMVFSGLTNVWQ